MASAQTETARGKVTPVQLGAGIVGIVFPVVGILGFIPGITTDHGDTTFATHDSEAMLLGVFGVNILHNIVHLIFGIVGVVTARAVSTSRYFLVLGGVIYLALWIYGVIIDLETAFNFVALNTADNWLHFLLGLGMVILGVALPRGRR